MTPKDKADIIVSNFEIEMYDIEAVDGGGWNNCRIIEKTVTKAAIQCALIAVEEIINVCSEDESTIITQLQYWQKVKNELLNLCRKII